MDTARIDICYRPLRIAWAIRSDDREAFRYAVRASHTMWGGRFNPIVMVDKSEAADLIELFRVDVIVPVGENPEVKAFAQRFPHLINPFIPDRLFLRDKGRPGRAHVLDMHNALAHWRDTPHWKALNEQGLRTFSWDEDDPLADAFLIQLGGYPGKEDVGIDYGALLADAAQPAFVLDIKLDKKLPINLETSEHPSIAHLSSHGVRRHYSLRSGWDYPGFFVGDASDLGDLVQFWNLRAADISLRFLDPQHLARYEYVRPQFEKWLKERLGHLDEHRSKVAVWTQRSRLEEATKLFPGGGIIACGIDEDSWGGGGVRVPMMILGEETSLGVIGHQKGQPRVSFVLGNKPFSSEKWFYTEHLVASISVGGLLSGDGQHTFHPPYVPELNEFFARTMHYQHDRLRIEPERVGIIIKAADHDSFLQALPTTALAENIFAISGLSAKPSPAGLITRQLISRLGGVDGTRAFKIPGVRRLIKTFGPRENFTKRVALQLIGGKDPENPGASFSDHEDLHIEARPRGTKLTAGLVFSHLVEKGLFRIGAELVCPTCALPNWIALDQLQQQNTCEFCGTVFDATRQLVRGEFHYRRTGVLGIERNAQGAIPVALLLQQLSVNVQSLRFDGIYLPSFNLTPKVGIDPPTCEIDFFVILPCWSDSATQIIFGESKDRGGVIDTNDVENMRRIADAFPKHRFQPFILFSKLGPFSEEEIALAKTLNGPHEHRVILLTDRELEPYHLFERTKKELGIEALGGDPAELALVTSRIYFSDKKLEAAAQNVE